MNKNYIKNILLVLMFISLMFINTNTVLAVRDIYPFPENPKKEIAEMDKKDFLNINPFKVAMGSEEGFIPSKYGIMLLTLTVLLFGVLPARIASIKGRYFFKWYLYGVFCGLIALVHSLLIDFINLNDDEYRYYREDSSLNKTSSTKTRYLVEDISHMFRQKQLGNYMVIFTLCIIQICIWVFSILFL